MRRVYEQVGVVLARPDEAGQFAVYEPKRDVENMLRVGVDRPPPVQVADGAVAAQHGVGARRDEQAAHGGVVGFGLEKTLLDHT